MPPGFQALSRLSVATTALFLDFDGTLARLVDRPENVRVDGHALASLARCYEALDGALAIVTGRDLASMDAFLAPHVFPASGVHGFEMRSGDGDIHRLPADLDALEQVRTTLAALAKRHDGLLLETKPGSIALHYRQRPDLGAACERWVRGALADAPDLRLMRGKMVVEVKAHAGDKGQAIAAFMEHPPFRGRTPVFIGDDVTDEAAFRETNARGGVSIKVGNGDSVAGYRLADPGEVHDWLDHFAASDKRQDETEGVAT